MNTPVNSNPSTAVPPPPKPPRNPVERIAVWGGIGLLLFVVALEFRAQRGYAQTLEALNTTAANEAKETSLAEARQLLAMSPAVSAPVPVGMYDEYTCSWWSLCKSGQYQITLVASREEAPLLMEFRTPNPPPEPEQEIAPIAEGGGSPSIGGMGMGGMGMGGMGMGGGGGMGGGQRRPNPVREALDANADGSLSADEISGAATELAKLDKDADGSLSAEELSPPPSPAADAPAGDSTAAAAHAGTASGGAAPAGPGSGGGGGGGRGGPGGGGRRPNRLVVAIDTNADGAISAEELAAAPAGLKSLDADGDGTIAAEELRPPGGFGTGGGGAGTGSSGRSRRPATEGTESPSTEAAPTSEPPAAKDSVPAEAPPAGTP